MTTIAFHRKDNQIAVDSRCTSGNKISSDKHIKYVKNNLGLWFLCGAICDIEDFITMRKNDKCPEETTLEAAALKIFNGKVYWCFIHDGVFCQEPVDCDLAIGSGGDFALAAMDFGKSAKDAVKYAMTRDSGTGGRVKVFDVK